jgi:hypothetical protein
VRNRAKTLVEGLADGAYAGEEEGGCGGADWTGEGGSRWSVRMSCCRGFVRAEEGHEESQLTKVLHIFALVSPREPRYVQIEHMSIYVKNKWLCLVYHEVSHKQLLTWGVRVTRDSKEAPMSWARWP